MKAHRLTATQRLLVEEYVAELRRAGMFADPKAVWPARAFAAQVGDPADWAGLSLAQQCALPLRLRHFVSWLAVTGRLTASCEQMADYVVVGRPFLGDVARRHHAVLAARFAATAEELGFARGTAVSQWSDVVKAAAVRRLRVDRLTVSEFVAGRDALVAAVEHHQPAQRASLTKTFFGAEATLFHMGVLSSAPTAKRSSLSAAKSSERAAQWAAVPTRLSSTLLEYLEQIGLTLRPKTVTRIEATLREFASFLATSAPDVDAVAAIRRSDVEAYKLHLSSRPTMRPWRHGEAKLSKRSIAAHLGVLASTFTRLVEWGGEDIPARTLLFSGDLPICDKPLPRFLDDAASAKLLVAARADPDPFVRLCVEVLARTGMRKGELIGLTVDAVVQIGSAYWLRVPVGKMHSDRYIPLHPQLKALIDDHLARRPAWLRSNLLFHDHGRPITGSKVDAAVTKVSTAAGIGHVHPHQLRHTLATQAINRGMSLEAIAALLGHRSLSMTLVYARLADRTVADEYFAVSERVEALYDQPKTLAADAEGAEMTKLRREMHQRMLGNGYCARPVDMDCHFESICESCSFFVTTPDFRPTLELQRDDAAAKGQVGRQKIFDGLIRRLEVNAS